LTVSRTCVSLFFGGRMSDKFYDKLYEKPAFKVAERPERQAPVIEDITELAKSELPALVAQAIELAKGSDKLSEVIAVIKELSDRAYGKATTKQEPDAPPVSDEVLDAMSPEDAYRAMLNDV
jgi:hypothetical protein